MKKFNNFERSLTHLTKLKKISLNLNTDPDYFDLAIHGAANMFWHTFELSWKTLKEIMENEGLTVTGSPKKIIKQAYETGIIQEEIIWLRALEDRNTLTHLYSEQNALEIFNRIQEQYIEMFEGLRSELEKNWLNS